jgi:cupin superfamily acireductone dioxygenase involved in methionine salvage
MPDIMDNQDGVLYIKGKNDKEYWIRPVEDDLIILPADMPHSPNSAPNSKQDRIVFAASIGFDFIKTKNSLI